VITACAVFPIRDREKASRVPILFIHIKQKVRGIFRSKKRISSKD
jgi:hypothetical protein